MTPCFLIVLPEIVLSFVKENIALKLLPKKALILGANGLLGQNLVRIFANNYDVFAVAAQAQARAPRPEVQYQSCDVADRGELRKLIKKFVPNYILNAAAFTDVDGCEIKREECWRVNATAVGYLAEAARSIEARVIHVSTDYVFDGTTAPYNEESRPQPLGYYGKAKLAGENALSTSGANYAIARTMILYGSGKNIRPNFVTWLIGQLRAGKEVRIVNDQYGNPTLASELAVALRKLAESKQIGIFHLSGAETVSRYDLAVQVARVFELNEQLIHPVTTAELSQAAKRPMNSGFDISKAQRELGVKMSNVAEGLRKFKEELLME